MNKNFKENYEYKKDLVYKLRKAERENAPFSVIVDLNRKIEAIDEDEANSIYQFIDTSIIESERGESI